MARALGVVNGRHCPTFGIRCCGSRWLRHQVGVEARGNHAKQQPRAVGHAQAIVAQGQQAVALRRLQPRCRLGHQRMRIDAVAPAQFHQVHFAAAHEVLDQVRAQQVVVLKHQAAPHRKPARVDGAFPAGQVARILRLRFCNAADRTYAEADRSVSAWVV